MGLQFSWIEANLIGFFLADVRNSRGKFDEIKEKFTINPAPIASQSSLNAGGSRWTRDLPRNLLNSFTNRSKVENKEGRIHRFYRENWPEDRGQLKRLWERFCGVVGAIPSCGSVTSILRQFLLQFRLQKCYDRATIIFNFHSKIGRDRFNFASKIGKISVESCVVLRGFDSTMEGPQSRLDCGLIGPRSWSSSANPLNCPISFHWVDGSILIVRHLLWWRSGALRVTTWRQVSHPIASLTIYIKHVLIWWSRGLGSTRS